MKNPVATAQLPALVPALGSARVTVALMLTTLVSVGWTQDRPVFPPTANFLGQTMGEWSAAWWKWSLGIPLASNPMLDLDGRFCGVAQSGQVWFLAGALGSGAVNRSCTVPAGKVLIFPIVNAAYIGTEPGETPEFVRQWVKSFIDAVDVRTLAVTVDGVAVKDLETRRAASPLFDVILPLDNVFGAPPGRYWPAASDGYWIMVHLPRGPHVLH